MYSKTRTIKTLYLISPGCQWTVKIKMMSSFLLVLHQYYTIKSLINVDLFVTLILYPCTDKIINLKHFPSIPLFRIFYIDHVAKPYQKLALSNQWRRKIFSSALFYEENHNKYIISCLSLYYITVFNFTVYLWTGIMYF